MSLQALTAKFAGLQWSSKWEDSASFTPAVVFLTVATPRPSLNKSALNVRNASAVKLLSENQRRTGFSMAATGILNVTSFHGISRLQEIVLNAGIS